MRLDRRVPSWKLPVHTCKPPLWLDDGAFWECRDCGQWWRCTSTHRGRYWDSRPTGWARFWGRLSRR